MPPSKKRCFFREEYTSYIFKQKVHNKSGDLQDQLTVVRSSLSSHGENVQSENWFYRHEVQVVRGSRHRLKT